MVSWWRPCSCSSTPAKRWRCQSPLVTSHKSRTGQVLAVQWNILFWNSPHMSTYPPSSYCSKKWVKQRFNLQIHICRNKEIYLVYIHIFFLNWNSKIVFWEFTVNTCTSTICGLTQIKRGVFSRVGARECSSLFLIPVTQILASTREHPLCWTHFWYKREFRYVYDKEKISSKQADNLIHIPHAMGGLVYKVPVELRCS